MRAAAEAAGGRLVDLGTRLKDIDSLRRKVEGRLRATPGAKAAEVLTGINDLVRYRIVAEAADYWATVDATIAGLRASSMHVTAARNTWDTSNYRALNATFLTTGGVLFEVQFHTPESRGAAARARPFYQELRVTIDKRRRRQLYREIGLTFRDVPVPPGQPTGTISL